MSEATLYKWRSEARAQGQLLPAGVTEPSGWSSDDKFNAVLETAASSQAEIAEYCCRRGLYAEQVQHWRAACAQANGWADRSLQGERAGLKGEKARRRRAEILGVYIRYINAPKETQSFGLQPVDWLGLTNRRVHESKN